MTLNILILLTVQLIRPNCLTSSWRHLKLLLSRRPALENGDIIVMDNLKVHHYDSGEILEDWINELGIELLYTPVYSPGLGSN